MITGQLDKAHKFGDLVPKIVEKYPKSKCNGSAMYVYLAFIYWRKNRLVDYAEGLEKALPLCLGYGDMIFAAYCCYQRIICFIIGAAPLDISAEKIIKYFEFIDRHKITSILDIAYPFVQYIKCLRGQTESPSSFNDNKFNEEAYKNNEKNPNALFTFHLCKAMALFYNCYYRRAFVHIKKAEENLSFVSGTILVPHFHFFYGIILGVLLSEEKDAEDDNRIKLTPASPTEDTRKQNILTLEKHWKILRDYSFENYGMFQHKILLLEAEFLRAQKLPEDSKLLHIYDVSVSFARKERYYHIETIAQERIATYYLRSKKMNYSASLIFQECYGNYLQWGAKFKIENLKFNYGSMLQSQQVSV